MGDFVTAAKVSEISEGEGKVLNVNGREIALFKRNPTPPVIDWRIARSLRSLGRISKCTKIENFRHPENALHFHEMRIFWMQIVL